MTAAADTVSLTLAEIHALAAGALQARGFGAEAAAAIAGCVTDAERDGARSHGLARIPVYGRGVASGRINGHARPVVTADGPAHLVVDADGGYAAQAVAAARPAVAALAAEQGMALASIRNSHHLHALWWDVEPLAEQGLMAIAVCAARPVMAVFGGTGRALGTNPIALSCPRAGAGPLTVDMATSAAARGDIGLHARAKEPIPKGWALGPDGQPTEDAEAALAGTQLPFADSPKASALALMVELMAAGLSGGRFGFEAVQDKITDDAPLKTGSILLAFDPARLGASHFAQRVDALVQHLVGTGAQRLPGERRRRNREAAATAGHVAISAGLVAELRGMEAGR